MKHQELEIVIANRVLPKDEINKNWGWSMLWGQIQIIVLLVIGFMMVFDSDAESISYGTRMTIFFSTLIVSLAALYSLLTERKLKRVDTSLSAASNYELAKTLIERKNWKVVSNERNLITVNYGSTWGHDGFKLTLIPDTDSLYLNLRWLGAWKGRVLFPIGLRFFEERRIRKELKKCITTSDRK